LFSRPLQRPEKPEHLINPLEKQKKQAAKIRLFYNLSYFSPPFYFISVCPKAYVLIRLSPFLQAIHFSASDKWVQKAKRTVPIG
jgi:hypothetical protein